MDLVVHVEQGAVRGRCCDDGVLEFLGLPYAASPAGHGRFRPPEPPAPWSGVRDALDHGPIAPQPDFIPGIAIPDDPDLQDEDCLSVNIWTQGLEGPLRPVMVWIHGGGFDSGAGSSRAYDGRALARTGDVVVVTCNYRLGALGFLAHPGLAEESGAFGNYGLLDQVAALRWVAANVERFGGDSRNVTVFGESAGSSSIACLLAMREARQYFTKAILQSGPAWVHDAQQGGASAEALCALLEVPVDRAALERIPSRRLVEAVAALGSQPGPAGQVALPLVPVVDGRTLVSHPQSVHRSGQLGALPMLIGTNKDEWTMMAASVPSLDTLSDAQLTAHVEHIAPSADGAKVVAAYRSALASRGESTSPRDLLVAIATDLTFRWGSLRLADANHMHGGPTYVYLFEYESPLLGGAFRSCHALEIPFVFGTFVHPHIALLSGSGPGVTALSETMMESWCSFARTGDPATGSTGAWEVWDRDRRATMVLGPRTAQRDRPRDEELSVLESSLGLD